jgi:hypothetical protein
MGTLAPSTETTSLDINPLTPPDPYLISNLVPFLEKVEDDDDL